MCYPPAAPVDWRKAKGMGHVRQLVAAEFGGRSTFTVGGIGVGQGAESVPKAAAFATIL